MIYCSMFKIVSCKFVSMVRVLLHESNYMRVRSIITKYLMATKSSIPKRFCEALAACNVNRKVEEDSDV
jgi:hypothetical protein